mmetsp:Transcript_1703/g.1496  ORF Transcript_1703/g.1496 Transcript_1703/m.1496 type:complete len:238 (-) Transcript_1703:159-872(-)
MSIQILRKRERKAENKDEIIQVRKEKNREKAQIFRQRKKEYINTLEKKVEQLEGKVYNLTLQLEDYKYEHNFSSSHEVDLFAEMDSMNLDDQKTFSKQDDVFNIEHMCGYQEKLMLLFNQTPIDEHKDSFKYFGKMGSYMKTELLEKDELNILERFMLECDMTPIDIQRLFQNINLNQLNQAMKSVAETILDAIKNVEVLQKCAKKALDQILNNLTSSQTHKMRLVTEEVRIVPLLF